MPTPWPCHQSERKLISRDMNKKHLRQHLRTEVLPVEALTATDETRIVIRKLKLRAMGYQIINNKRTCVPTWTHWCFQFLVTIIRTSLPVWIVDIIDKWNDLSRFATIRKVPLKLIFFGLEPTYYNLQEYNDALRVTQINYYPKNTNWR